MVKPEQDPDVIALWAELGYALVKTVKPVQEADKPWSKVWLVVTSSTATIWSTPEKAAREFDRLVVAGVATVKVLEVTKVDPWGN